MGARTTAAWRWLGTAVAIAMLLVVRDAGACPSARSEVSHIVGFEEDGRHVRYHRYENAASEDLHDESFTLYDAAGKELSRLTLVWIADSKRTAWKRTGSAYFGRLAEGLEERDARKLERAIVAKHGLKSAPIRRKIRHVKSEAVCGSIELETELGWLRVAEADLWQAESASECLPFQLGAFEHPKVNAVFVRFVLRVGRGDTLREEDVVLRLPKARVRGIKLARKGERLRGTMRWHRVARTARLS